jgi:hypothetical protein
VSGSDPMPAAQQQTWTNPGHFVREAFSLS